MQNPFIKIGEQSRISPSTPILDSNPRQRAWIEVDPQAISFNTKQIKDHLKGKSLLMAVVKADGYGHGAATVAKAAIEGGADSLGIATLQEGIELREAKVRCPILVLGNLVDAIELKTCLKWALMPTLSNIQEAYICEEIAQQNKQIFYVQVKIDTGMTRLGCELKEAKTLINFINNSQNLMLRGIYSHLALGDKENNDNSLDFTSLQKERFDSIVKTIAANEIDLHLANSAGTLRDSNLHYDMVRVGIAIYGYNPIKNQEKNLILKPALAVKARVTLIRDVYQGIGVSYGHKFITQRASRLAVISIGYADGIQRTLSGKISVLFRGQLLPQVGAITMDQMMIDITDAPDITVGAIITLLGKDGDSSVSAEDWASLSGSITWEILCGFKHRLPRVVI
tara:strand:+ start:700 stop:1890 length:1191 start_codon:yes stop_codon:yes gene_type:complete